jgi:hypothetical protein
LSRRYDKDLKPGTMFGGWLVLAGIGRVIIEFFRPDQPKIETLGISYSAIFAALMAIVGAILLMVRYKALNPAFAEDWEEEYRISGEVKTPEGKDELGESEEVEEPLVVDEDSEAPQARKVSTTKKTPTRTSKTVKKAPVRKTTKKTESAPRTTRAKKSSE